MNIRFEKLELLALAQLETLKKESLKFLRAKSSDI